VLNGGLASWIAAGGAIERAEAAPVEPGNFVAAPQPGYFVDKADVKALLERQSAPLLSGLRHTQFTGEGSDDPRAGHIPGSLSMPYNDLLDSAGRLDLDKVADIYAQKGLKEGPAPVLYCGGGINAAGLALALSAIGQHGLSVYDGSLNEWKADASLPLVRGGA
jgi:thiosulfate/3-mercaptopyruvate sulfurtransferase